LNGKSWHPNGSAFRRSGTTVTASGYPATPRSGPTASSAACRICCCSRATRCASRGGGIALVYGGHRRQRVDRPRRRLRSCSRESGDLPAIRHRAKGNAIRHDVRAVHVCAGLPSARFLAVAQFPWLSRRVAGSRGSQWRRLTARYQKDAEQLGDAVPWDQLVGLAAFRAELPKLTGR
jgi:hypothetical protein